MGTVDAFLPALLHGLPEAVVGADVDDIIRVWNAGAVHLFGNAETSAVGKTVVAVLGPTLGEGRARTAAGDEIAVEVEVVACDDDGSALLRVLIIRAATTSKASTSADATGMTAALAKTALFERFEGELSLPPRLRETLQLLVEGFSEKQLADQMKLSPHTVHDYVKALYRRMGVQSRAELVARVVRTVLSERRAAPTGQRR